MLSLERVEEAGGGPAGEREAAQDRGVAGQEGGHAGAGQQQEVGGGGRRHRGRQAGAGAQGGAGEGEHRGV